MFSSFLVVLTFISLVSALASPHMSHAVHRHRSLSARIAAPVAEPIVGALPVVPKRTRSRRQARRANAGRCKASSVAQASSTSLAQQVSSTAPSTSATPESTSAAPATSFTPVSTAVREHPTSSSSSSSSSSSVAQETQPAATPTPAPQPTTTTSSAQATSTSGSSGGSTSESFTGEITFYETGLGSCGETSTDSDHIVALSQILYDQYTPAGNANNNSLCGKFIHIEYGGKSTDVKVVDRCTGCAEHDLDLSPAAFDDLASESLGRLQGATWSFTS